MLGMIEKNKAYQSMQDGRFHRVKSRGLSVDILCLSRVEVHRSNFFIAQMWGAEKGTLIDCKCEVFASTWFFLTHNKSFYAQV